MPVDSSTYQKYYNALQQAYGKNGAVEKNAFNLGFDDFKQKLANQDYAQKIYGALDQAYGKQGAVEKDAFTLPFQDFYGKVSRSSSAPNQPAPQPSQPPPTAPDISDIFRQQPRESSNIPSVNLPGATPSATAIDQHSKEIDRAANNLTQTFNQNKDKAITGLVRDDFKQQQDRLNSAYQNGIVDEKTFQDGQNKLFNRMVNPGADIANFKQEMAADPSKVRHVVDVIAKNNPDKANQIKADMYLMDSKNRPEKSTMILHNANAIANGNGLDYDIKQGVLKGQEGFFQSLGQGFSERNRMMNDYGFYTSETPDKIINKLEGQRASYDPDLPVNMPYGIGGHLGQAIGQNGIATAKASLAGSASSLIPVVGEIASPWVASAAVSPEFYKTGYVASLENNYHQLRNQGLNPQEALSKAQERAAFDAKVDVAQGVIGTAVGARIGLKGGDFTPTFENTIKNIAVHSGKWLTETGVEGGANALLATGLQELKNIHSGRPAEEGAFETGMGQLMFAYGLGALTKTGRALLNPKAYRSVLQTMARAPEDQINTGLASMVRDGSMSNEDAADVHSQLMAQRQSDSKIPPEVTNDNDRAKIQDMISQRDALDAKMETVDKAYHPELKEQIKALNEKIAEASKNPSQPSTKPSTEPTFSAPEDQQKLQENEIISQLKPSTNGQETQGNAEAEKVGSPEGAVTEVAAAPSFLQSRHADTIHDEEGIVSGPNNKELSTKGKRDANDLAKDVEGKGVTKVITSGLERSKETGHTVADKVGATVDSRPELNTWDIHNFDGLKDEDFKDVQKWFVEHPDEITYRGPIEKYQGKQVGESVNEYAQRVIPAMERVEKESGPETLLINHSNNMMLWDAYLKNGREWNDQTRQDYLHAEKPEPATLTNPPNISYPKITNVKLKENASNVREGKGQLPTIGEAPQGSQEISGNDVQQVQGQPSGRPGTEQQAGQPIPEESQGAGEKETIPPVHDDDWPFVEEPEDNEVTSLKNAVTAQKVEDAGLIPAMKEAKRSYGKVWDEAQKKIAKGYDIEGLVDSLKKKPRPLSDLEDAMVLYHQTVKESQLSQANKDLDAARASNDKAAWTEAYNTRAKLLDDLQKLYDVDKAVGTANARGLNARKMMADRRFSLVNMQAEKRAANGGEPLTDEQLDQIKSQYEEIKKTKEEYEARVEQLKKENASLEAERNFLKLKGGIKEEKISKKKAAIKKDLADNFAEFRKILKDQRGKLSANPIPVEAIPVIGKMAKNLVRLGAVKLSEVANRIYDELKGDIPELTKEHVQEAIDAASNAERLARFKENVVQSKLETEMKTRTGDFSKKETKPLVLDREGMRLKGEYEKAKDKYQLALKKDELSKRNAFQKTADIFVKWERAFKLSNPITLAKLSMAATTRLAQTLPEEALGHVYSAALPKVAKAAEGESGAHVTDLVNSYKKGLMQGLKDSYDILKSKGTGKSDLDYQVGSKSQLPPEAIDFFGQLHGAIKAPVKRFAFELSLGKRLRKNMANGVDVTDPEVQTRILMDSYKDAQRAIFMQDNFVSKSYQNFVSSLERSKDHPNLGKASSSVLQYLIPFVKVPTNIVGEVGTNVAGLPIAGAKILHTAFTKGLDNLSSDEADFILRNMKKGTLGAGALLLGYFRPDLFGGYYQPREKRKEGDLKAGEMNVGGMHIPMWLLESPIFQTMQLGATIRKAKDKMTKGQPGGIGEGIWAGALGLAQHEPLIDQPARMAKIFDGKNERDYYLGELAKSTVDPAILDFAAKATDPEKARKPGTILEHVKMGIPGLRETVPVKKESGGGDDRDGGSGGGAGAGGDFDR